MRKRRVVPEFESGRDLTAIRWLARGSRSRLQRADGRGALDLRARFAGNHPHPSGRLFDRRVSVRARDLSYRRSRRAARSTTFADRAAAAPRAPSRAARRRRSETSRPCLQRRDRTDPIPALFEIHFVALSETDSGGILIQPHPPNDRPRSRLDRRPERAGLMARCSRTPSQKGRSSSRARVDRAASRTTRL